MSYQLCVSLFSILLHLDPPRTTLKTMSQPDDIEVELIPHAHTILDGGNLHDDCGAVKVKTDEIATEQPHSPMRRLRRSLKPLDQFKFIPIPRHVKEEQISLRGLLGTLFLFALTFAYVVLTVVRFFTDGPAISIVTDATNMDPIQVPDFAWTFRRNVDGRPLDFFYDDRYFRIVMSTTVVQEQDFGLRNTTDIPTVRCNVSAWAGWSGGDAICPNATVEVYGRYQSSSYQFFSLHVRTCDDAAPFVYPNGSIVSCAPQSEIDAVLTNGRFNLLTNYETWEGNQFESDWYLYNPDLRQLYEGIYHKLHITESPDYVRNFLTTEKKVLRLGNEKTLSQPTQLVPNGGGRVVLSRYVRLNSYEMLEERQNENVLDPIGSWNALYGAIFGALALYFATYNENKFYRENPGWDKLGSAPFRSDAPSGSLEYQANES